MYSYTSNTLTALLFVTVLLVVVATNAAPGQCAGCDLPNGGLKGAASSYTHPLSNPTPPSITTSTSLTTEVDVHGFDGPTTLFSPTTTSAVTSATIDSDYTVHLIRVDKPDPDCAGCTI